ncbi:hypothetical protein BCV72DRAFT_314344, partial [Rhizopus microsporus var. microsporus]
IKNQVQKPLTWKVKIGCAFFKQVFLDNIASFRVSKQSECVVVLSSPGLTSPYPSCLPNFNYINVDMIASGRISGAVSSILFSHFEITFFIMSANIPDNKGFIISCLNICFSNFVLLYN